MISTPMALHGATVIDENKPESDIYLSEILLSPFNKIDTSTNRVFVNHRLFI